MKDFDRFIKRFIEFGGLRLVWQYAKMGVLWTGVKEMVRCVLHGRSFKTVYPVITKRVDERLVAKYETVRCTYDTRSLSLRNVTEGDYDTQGKPCYDNVKSSRELTLSSNGFKRTDAQFKEGFSQSRDAEKLGHATSLDDNLAENELSQDNISIPSDNSQSASLRKEQRSCSQHSRKDFEPLNQRATASVLNSLNQRSALNPLNAPAGAPIWFCWLQGMENAPELVKVCLESIKRNVTERVVVLDDRNYTEYVELPEYVVEKYRRDVIPGALFSDMLRLELLIKYGGTWIDSTVWASPGVRAKDSKCWQAWQKICESELFIYRYFNWDGRIVGTSNWFIHAKAGNRLLMDVRDMLFAYWRDYNCVVEYYIFHLFFGVVAKRYPEMMARMPKGNSFHALLLRDRIYRPFDAEWWGKLTANVPFHKLNYRKMPKNVQGTFYEFVVQEH